MGYPGIGDPYYPTAGNGGYQVDAYDITLSYDPAKNDLQSTALITGSVTSDDGLTQFDLDLQPSMTVSSVQVDGTDAQFAHQAAELVITPAAELAAQAAMTVKISVRRAARTDPRRHVRAGRRRLVPDHLRRRGGDRRAVLGVGVVPGQRAPGRSGDVLGDRHRPTGLAGDLQRCP